METAFDCNYLDKPTLDNLLNKSETVGKMLNGMINKSNLFCKDFIT
ncbi:MAG: hypothetical protein KJZ60_04330 [Ignavibacteriaceae bacterium]|nr:hypothetical protein [Ignavibacteriaceae bacterium]